MSEEKITKRQAAAVTYAWVKKGKIAAIVGFAGCVISLFIPLSIHVAIIPITCAGICFMLYQQFSQFQKYLAEKYKLESHR